jgi:cytochrome c biogenesis protein CcmG, thiol:disulfide interchange protein DsbE
VRRVVAIAAAPLLALALLGSAGAQQPGRPLPDIELRDQYGERVNNDDLLGQRWMLNVWASWCPPCRAELPLLARAAEELADQGVGLLLLNAGESASVAAGFLEAEGLALRTLVDPDQSERGLESTNDTLRRLRTGGLPTTYFVGADGTLLATFIGELTPDALAERLGAVFGVDWSP